LLLNLQRPQLLLNLHRPRWSWQDLDKPENGSCKIYINQPSPSKIYWN
jgi:hypothetical protein